MNDLFIVVVVIVVGIISYKLGGYVSNKKNKPNKGNSNTKSGNSGLPKQKDINVK